MKTLIVGCGYLGMRVAQTWVADRREVVALTRSPVHAQQMQASGIQPFVGDVTEPESLLSMPRAHTVLYSVGYDRAASSSMREVYVDGLRHVLQSIAAHVQRFVYISSTSVYGQCDGELVDESSVCHPIRENGKICRDAERLVEDFFAENSSAGSGANILRLAGLYGPGRLIARAEGLRQGKPIEGNPEAWLNLIHVDDAVRAVHTCVDNGPLGETYLVCDDRPLRRREYYELLAAQLGAPPPRFEADERTHAAEQSLNKRCSNKKLREVLGVMLEFPDCFEGLRHSL